MAKRTKRGPTSKKKDKEIRCNRPNWRKKVIRREGFEKYRRRGKKIKSKKWEKV